MSDFDFSSTEQEPMCGKFREDEVVPNEQGNCSLCYSPMNEAGECLYAQVKRKNNQQKGTSNMHIVNMTHAEMMEAISEILGGNMLATAEVYAELAGTCTSTLINESSMEQDEFATFASDETIQEIAEKHNYSIHEDDTGLWFWKNENDAHDWSEHCFDSKKEALVDFAENHFEFFN